MIKIIIREREKWHKLDYFISNNKKYISLYNVFISNYGRVKSIKKNGKVHYFLCKPDRTGYVRINITCKNVNSNEICHKSVSLHRLVASMFVENKNPKYFTVVNHLDCNPLNNHYKNLEWTTQSGNMKYAYDIGRIKIEHGENHHNSKLNESDIEKIFHLRKNGLSDLTISKILKISRSEVNKIRNCKLWVNTIKNLDI